MALAREAACRGLDDDVHPDRILTGLGKGDPPHERSPGTGTGLAASGRTGWLGDAKTATSAFTPTDDLSDVRFRAETTPEFAPEATETKAHVERRVAEGLTRREIHRALTAASRANEASVNAMRTAPAISSWVAAS